MYRVALPLRSRGSGGRERTKGLQTAVVEHPARSMPPSPEVMPHDLERSRLRALPLVGTTVVANLLALRFAPRLGVPKKAERSEA